MVSVGVEGDVEYPESVHSDAHVASLVGLVAVEGAQTGECAVGVDRDFLYRRESDALLG